ncbi:DUF2336 domain-containing protein [Azospirillum sp. SYSU D00513]|uniref:DUF2336 domain-containing protein n=1 Tax=Azospirillum sp. SYSU D00513 TaxID=2812561 RepID=UPI001A96FC52|nr:DUF2336 domain-containing protein [Azospirillum sp. SYSU D00513]
MAEPLSGRLTGKDVTRLLSNPSSDGRADLAAKIALQLGEEGLSAAERRIAEDIIRSLASDAILRVRQTLAENLRSSPFLPRDVALTLARDVEAVAIPVLSVSESLTDADLLELVRSGGDAKQAAIAGRPAVSETVAEALIESGTETAVATLVGNAGARLSEAGLGRIIDRFGNSAAVKERIVQRPRLPITIAERLVAMVSDTLREHLVSRHDLPPRVAAELVLQSRERATLSLLAGEGEEGRGDGALERLVAQLSRAGRLTPSLLVRALCMGDTAFFEAAMAHLAEVSPTNARLLIHDAGRLGLKSIYDKAKLPPSLLPACRVALDVLRETDYDGGPDDVERYRRRVIERILTQYEEMGAEDLDYLLTRLGGMAAPARGPAPAH